jgi:phosphoglycolate phosphatase
VPPAAADLSLLDGAAILFDLDGTLVDTAPDLVGTLNWMLAEEGHPPLPVASVRTMIGRGGRWMLERGFTAAGVPMTPEQLDERFERFIDHYIGRIADESRPFPGTIAALEAMKAAGARLGVCTNKRTFLSVALLDALGMTSLFEAIVGPDLAGAQKPDRRHLDYAIAAVGGSLPRAVMVGDAATDAGAARDAGSGLILVSFGYTEIPAAELNPDILVEHFADVPAACVSLLHAMAHGRG